MSEERMAYIGVQSCGCITAATIDAPEYAKGVAKDLAAWIKRGLHVERVESAPLRDNPDFLPVECPHDPKGWEPQP